MELQARIRRRARRNQGRNPGLEVDFEMILSIPGHAAPSPTTGSSSLSCARWEAPRGQPHQPIRGTSGATDAAILRGRGIPTARLGLPRADPPRHTLASPWAPPTSSAMQRLTECLVYAIIDTCTRERSEVGLA